MANSFGRNIFNADHRYDTPSVSTNSLVEAVRKVTGYGLPRNSGDPTLDVIDVIRMIISDPTAQDAKIATFLIGMDYEVEDIRCACKCLMHGGPAFQCTQIKPEHQAALDELLEAKP